MSPRRFLARGLALAATASGWTRLARQRRRARGDFRVFILAYHDVTHGDEQEGVVSAERLRRHLAFLRRDHRLSSLSEAAERLARPGSLDEDLVVVTFDDGYRGNYEVAWPVLRDAGSSATIFLTSGFLDGEEMWFDFARRALRALRRPGIAVPEDVRRDLARLGGDQGSEPIMRRLKNLHPKKRQELLTRLRELELDCGRPTRAMSWDQARELLDHGIEMGGHTVTHPILATLNAAEQEEEIRSCRDRIAAKTGHAPTTFAYPNGSPRDFNANTKTALASSGFTVCCAMIRGSNRLGGDPLELRRIGVGHDPNFLLEARLAGLFDHHLRRRLGL